MRCEGCVARTDRYQRQLTALLQARVAPQPLIGQAGKKVVHEREDQKPHRNRQDQLKPEHRFPLSLGFECSAGELIGTNLRPFNLFLRFDGVANGPNGSSAK